jgi:NAD(P)H-hydrate repair Nnr-like enzyme with NAD(P)H-hydrate epimerase domain
MGPYEDLMLENGGRCIATISLQLLEKDVEKRTISILVGNCKAGAYGFATARHLINHGCEVNVITTYFENELNMVCTQRNLYSHCGGRIKHLEGF